MVYLTFILLLDYFDTAISYASKMCKKLASTNYNDKVLIKKISTPLCVLPITITLFLCNLIKNLFDHCSNKVA